MPSRLFELSLEILEYIITFLDLEEHLSLCLLSHQVHRYLLPSFLHRCEVGFSEDLTTLNTLSLRHGSNVQTENAIFKFVNASPCLTSIRHLECEFHCPESRVLWQFSNIQYILKKFQIIESVTLDFSKLSNWVFYTYSIPRAIRHRKTWDDLFLKIIKTLVERPPCHLSIVKRQQHLWFIPYPFQEKYLPSRGLIRNTVRRVNLFRKWTSAIRSRFVPSSSRTDVLRPPQRLKSLGKVDLSHITCLSLTDCNFAVPEWEAMAQGILLPSLREVRTKMGLSLTMHTLCYLFDFLHRHPSITLLHLRESMSWPTSTFKSRNFLPKLQSLHAPISLIFAFFDDKFIGAKANLTDMEIVCYPTAWYHWVDMFEWVGRLPKQLKGVPTSIELRLEASWLIWLVSPPPDHNAIVSITKLDVDLNGCDGFPSSVDFWSKLQAWLLHFPEAELICIHRLGGPITRHDEFVRSIFSCDAMVALQSVNIDDRLYLRGTPFTPHQV
ncbi:hypothetical protein ONZ45_g816 [Pleurotus djamor]|nr:hypothetical protein ONZ45_g816 [Pleurotus djamor]